MPTNIDQTTVPVDYKDFNYVLLYRFFTTPRLVKTSKYLFVWGKV